MTLSILVVMASRPDWRLLAVLENRGFSHNHESDIGYTKWDSLSNRIPSLSGHFLTFCAAPARTHASSIVWRVLAMSLHVGLTARNDEWSARLAADRARTSKSLGIFG